ncbi:MAG: transposase [Solirubrobacteraceae bacterium]
MVNDQQVILAAEITNAAPDFGQLAPMFQATMRNLAEHNVAESPEVLLADAGYWHHPQMQAITEQGVEVLAPPDGNMREGKRRGWQDGVYQQMRDKLSTDRGRELYAQRKSQSSRCSGRSNTTGTSTGSCEEAGPLPYLNGG